MGRILSTTYHDTVEKVSGFYNNLVNNPFYVLNDKKPTLCTYYNINKDFSSLDPGSKIEMELIGDESPIRYNKIQDFVLYGFNRIELNTESDEFGLEANPIEGECYILPNTIIPTEGDYFEIDHIKDLTWLFQVKDVQKDTLDNGSNAYKINYKLHVEDNSEIKNQIVHNFRLIESIEGTNVAKVVRCEDYDIAKVMDEKAVMLKKYYEDLFYNEKVQTFTYIDSMNFCTYDPYMIEFLIRNSILANGDESYIHIAHQIPVTRTFSLDYDRTFFRVFERNKVEKLASSNYSTYLNEIVSYGTTFSSRYEDYYSTEYKEDVKPGFNTTCINEEFIHMIVDNTMETDITLLWKNILIKYLNNMVDLTQEELDSIEDIKFISSKEAFYTIPLLIFCLEKYIENVLK